MTVLLAFTTAVPWAGTEAPVTVSGSLSGSLSLANTVTVTATFFGVDAVSLTATGGRSPLGTNSNAPRSS